MRTVLAIARKELYSYFTSPMAYVVATFYIGITSLLFVLYVGSGRAEAEMRDLFGTMIFLMLMMAPVITMALIAHERNLGTIETLLTRPIRDSQVVAGKYLAALALFLMIVVVSFVYPAIMSKFGALDWGETLIGYLGLVLVGAAFIAIGLFASSVTSNQIAAAVLGFTILLLFWLCGWIANSTIGTGIGSVLKQFSIYERVQDFEKGVFDTKPLIFFASMIFFFLFLTVRSLETHRA
jgi:ABC-2 type transport system permease protein